MDYGTLGIDTGRIIPTNMSAKLINPKNIEVSLTPGVLFCSKVRVFNECQRKFYYQYVRNLEPTGTSLPLFIGSMVHKAMEDWYGGMSPDDVCGMMSEHIRKEMHKKGIGRDSDELTKHTAMIQGMIAGYMEVFKDDLTDWNIIRTEQSFLLDTDGNGPFISTLDTMLVGKKGLAFNDFKTAASIDGEVIKSLGMDLQMQTYWRVVEQVLNMKIAEAYYTVIKKPKIRQKQTETAEDYAKRVMDLYTETPDDYYHREPIRRSQKHIDEVAVDLTWYISAIYDKFETNDENILHPQHWPRNTKACRNFFKNCPFTDPCRYGETTDKFLYFTERTGIDRGTILTELPQDKPKLKELRDEINN